MSLEQLPFVLYVDDEPTNLRVFEANFRTRFRLLTCSKGEDALALIAQRGHEIGVLISDQRMPGMTGIELLEQVRASNPDIQRMIVTAYSDMQAVMDAVNRGQVARYFIKPWSKEELGSALDEALRYVMLQARLREMEVRLRNSERLAAIGQVSAGIAHELMNPLAYVSQNVSTLKSDFDVISAYTDGQLKRTPNEPVRAMLQDVPAILDDLEKGTRHIRQVALNIRSQARGDEKENTSDLADVVGFAVKLARSQLKERPRLVVKGESIKVVGGPVKLCQVLLNLLVNAAHALEGVGRPGLIEVSWAIDGKNVQLKVDDNGCGIPAEHLQKVFEPLFTTKAPGVGTGLGLSICRELIRSIDGDIQLRSTVGKGTTVEIRLVQAPV